MIPRKKRAVLAATTIFAILALFGCASDAANTTETGSVGTAVQEPRPVPDDPSKKVVAYFIQWGVYARDYLVEDIPADKITHINYAFAKIANGAVVSADPFADFQKAFGNEPADAPFKGNFYQLIKLKEAYPDLKVLISIGGWTLSDGFSTAAATPEGRKLFSDSAVAFMRRFQLDGIDLDWEYPVEGGIAKDQSPADKENFSLMLRDLRLALDAAGDEDGRRYLLTAAVSAGVDKVANLEVPKLAQYMDWINIMAYDFRVGSPGVAGHHSPLYDNPANPVGSEYERQYNVDGAVRAYLDAGMPADQIVLGVPFYGRGWEGFPEGQGGLYATAEGAAKVGTWEGGVFDYDDLVENYVAADGSNVLWDDIAMVPYIYDEANERFISFDNTRSMQLKLDYAADMDLAGIMYWELSQDRSLELVNLIAENVLE